MEQRQSLTIQGLGGVTSDTPEPIQYCLYARKSSEADEAQALSIDSQIKEMQAMAERDGLVIADIYYEAHSAKDSGQRPVFRQLLFDIKSGKFTGILTWAPDRISRNAGDLGSVVDLMDQGYIKEIRTNGQVFRNSPNEKFLLMILCSQAKLENDHKGENVKRGQRALCEKGIRPGIAPVGYINITSRIRGNAKIVIDPERAPIIRQMFEKVAKEFWTGRELYVWVNDEMKYLSKGGAKMSLSSIFKILHTTFYYGSFEFPEKSGNWYQGTHEPLITKQIFDRVQGNLCGAEHGKHGLKEFAFTKTIICGTCGSGVTAEEKIKKSSRGWKRYTYYHCIKKIKSTCNESWIREEELLEALLKSIDTLDFNNTKMEVKFKEEIAKYNKFSSIFLKQKEGMVKTEFNCRDYVKYILSSGSYMEKRVVLQNLHTKIILKDKSIILEGK